MTLRKQIKQNGKRCLYNNWGKAISIVLLGVGIYLLFAILETIASALLGMPFSAEYYDTVQGLAEGMAQSSTASLVLTGILAVGSFLIVGPLNMGILQWYRRLSDGESEDILAIFCYFSDGRLYFQSLWLLLNLWVRSLLAGAVFVLPAVLTLAGSRWAFEWGEFEGAYFVGAMGTVLGTVLLAVTLVAWAIYCQRYFLSKYYLIEGGYTVRQAIRRSVQSTAGLHDSIFLYLLSYSGWLLLCVLVLPWLYVAPYYQASTMLYARFLMEQDERGNKLAVYRPAQSAPQSDPGQATRQFEL